MFALVLAEKVSVMGMTCDRITYSNDKCIHFRLCIHMYDCMYVTIYMYCMYVCVPCREPWLHPSDIAEC